MLRRPLAVFLSIAVPTLFLCWVDVVAIRAGTWHISLATSTGKFVVPHLPVEEFLFFALVNTILVFATCAIDRSTAILHLFKEKNPSQSQKLQSEISLWRQMLEMIWAFFLTDQMLNYETVQDLSVSWDILRKASSSFYTASAVFPNYIRQELGVLYAFCRVTDDLCDDETVLIQERRQQLKTIRQFVNDLFGQKSSSPHVIDWDLYNGKLPDSCISAFKSFTRLRDVLEADAIHELLNGYKWDLDRRSILNKDDLRRYSACVASSVGEMCTRIILAHSDNKNTRKESQWIIQRAREMGLVLQYTNIARDIITDSNDLGRCYLPQEWLTNNEINLIQSGDARKISEQRLLSLSQHLVAQADDLMVIANKGIDRLPSHCQGGVRAACNVYTSIGIRLKSYRNHYPTRAHVGNLKKMKIALLSVYNLYAPPITAKQNRQGKMRNLNTI
ncbi:Squalene/phytoene synthase-domain-containing protein [Parasitella parasitica]|nr:Squalene/phytoene synthase-domain-containing protein [Parasitella parasitica]